MDTIADLTRRIQPLDERAMAAARARQDTLTKPMGSLGRLEELSVLVAGITGRQQPVINHRVIVTMAADHGVTAEGVSAYPREVTPQMVYNFVNGGAGINVLARRANARVVVVDMGVDADFPPGLGIVDRKIARGTNNMAAGPAMTREQAVAAVLAGAEIVEWEIERGLDILGTGDMGIGNTTPSSAMVATFTGADVAGVTGRGTGVDDLQWAHKVEVIERALALNKPDPADPLDVLAKVGGFEIAGIAGAILGAAANRRPVIIDGFISGAAALFATELCPAARDYLIAAHSSVEVGHRTILERMELVPLLNLNLRLGEGTGAALAMPLVDAALAILSGMATFAEAGVSDRDSAV
ncbi:MAG: nicotinate-nucleotide--dimethylbenzimidazole phosphoribosyltransferase [Chloroflexi bacterium]|nr:nicotinate-nucleotide--dimethylbenzimidazole phosphoribosyltransferase [Chloroflexota bacterium]